MGKCLIGRMIKRVNNRFENEVNRLMSEHNITRSQMDLLIYTFIKNNEGKEVNQVDIERELNLTNPTVTGLINRLEKKAYIKREISQKGAKYKSIVVTEEGIALIKKGRQIAESVEKRMLSILEKEEKEELARLLKKVIDNKNY